jgi:hypothetical protein
MKMTRFRNGPELFSYFLAVLTLSLFCSSVEALPINPTPQILEISPMTFLTFSNLTVGESYQMQRTLAWYWTNVPVSFTATNEVYTQMVTGAVRSSDYRLAQNPVPVQAFAVAQVVNGSVVGVTMTDGGSGYVTAPSVLVVRGGGTNATATASISGGSVVGISITSIGVGYTNTPIVQIAPPPAVAVLPSAKPVMRLNVSSSTLGWRIQFASAMGAGWQPYGLVTNTPMDLFITNNIGFFRLTYP